MNNSTRSHRFVKPAVCECELIQQPIAPCEILNGKGAPGKLRINATVYVVEILGYLPDAGEPIIDGYRLTRDTGEAHDLCLVAGRLECTCGDWLWRRSLQTDRTLADCKHVLAVKRLLTLPVDQKPQPQPRKLAYRFCSECGRYDVNCTCPPRPQEPAPVVCEFDDP